MSPATTCPDTRADELLAIRSQLGERDAFAALIQRWHAPLRRYLRSLADSDAIADDLTQDTWLRVLRSIASLRETSRLRSWIFGIARRVAMDRLRFRYAHPTAALAEIDSLAAPEVDEGLESDLAAMQSGLAGLPPSEREPLALFYLHELTIEQMAALLHVPTGTVKSRLFRARELLRRALDIEGETR